MSKYIFNFGDEIGINTSREKIILGSKGYNLSLMTKLGLPVPPGFTITTDATNRYLASDNDTKSDLYELHKEDILKHLGICEQRIGKKFAGLENPLLISVRSGAAVSMPGMMDTILNLGINDSIAEALAMKTNKNFAYDCYLRFVKMFSSIALKLNVNGLEKNLAGRDPISVIKEYKKFAQDNGKIFPNDPYDQLKIAIKSVVDSWNSERARVYRTLHSIPKHLGTAVTIQTMVFGNYDQKSGTGVLFTRNPSNGENKFFGEFLPCAQGEDIVSGKNTPQEIGFLASDMKEQYLKLSEFAKKLETYHKDLQDIEFTIESGQLYILQTRSGKRTTLAAVKIASDLANEGIISEKDAIMRVDSSKIGELLHPSISEKHKLTPIAKGLAASPGSAVGRIVFSSESVDLYAKSSNVILVRNDTCPEDIKGMSLSKAIITSRGGITSHAAVVARGMGKPCICGIQDLQIDLENKKLIIGSITLNELDEITIDGTNGDIYLGALKLSHSKESHEFFQILSFADKIKKISVRANAETKTDLEAALEFKADGIGLCRTEHMFFEPEKISLMRQMILAESFESRKRILSQIYPLHLKDFLDLFTKLNGKSLNIRLLDPPLHEFLPKEDDEIERLASTMNLEKSFILHQIERLSEANPMLGHRGARLGVTHPDIYEMQVQAIIEAAIRVKNAGIDISPEIMLPLISNEKELLVLKDLVTKTANNVMDEIKTKIHYKIGTMIELPRAVMIADKIAKHVDFFSFGTNDLTQTIYGISRDDISSFMPEYKAAGIFKDDPFGSIDQEGVGAMIKEAIMKGKATNPNIYFGVCGEHGGDARSIKFFDKLGVEYVSCSPYRIAGARIAAAQSAILKSESLGADCSELEDNSEEDDLDNFMHIPKAV
ncbi:MAG: pyruvate, phosphate dikinase [Rickettsiaceae bacterium]|nr:pyruvate, phosphate dikinase [Rickettsiaceae bacterium]